MRKVNQNRLIYSILIALCIIGFWWFENFYQPPLPANPEGDRISVPDFFLPKADRGEVVVHDYYSLSYVEAYEQAQYVVYRLDREHLTYEDRDRPYFIEDPKVRTKSADWRNYKNSGFDRGHLCPAGDRRFSDYAYNETFYTSNISPQEKAFNAGVWNRLEQQVRRWAKRYQSVYVATAGVLDNPVDEIGEEDVAVPRYFYKIVARGRKDNIRVIAFLVPHSESNRPLTDFVVSVDEVEALTGIDFLPGLEDKLEEKIEAGDSWLDWQF